MSIFSLGVGEFASTRVQQDLTLGSHIPRWSGWTWATVGLALLVTLGLEGAFQEIRNVRDSSDQELKSQRQDYEDQLRAEQSTHAAEKAAHEDTRKALEKEEAQPVSRDHRDRMIQIARSMQSRISGGMDCRYWVNGLREADAKNMIAAHFPREAEVFNTWDSLVARQDECTAKLYEKVRESINRRMSSLPWQPEGIAGAFDQYMQQWLRTAGAGVRPPDFTLIIEEGRGAWQAPGIGSQTLNFTVFENIDAPEQATRCEADFNEWFKEILPAVSLLRCGNPFGLSTA